MNIILINWLNHEYIRGMNYNIGKVCTLCANDRISLEDLKMQIYDELRLLSNRFNLNIKARINNPDIDAWF
jgi:hypothetical protein